MRNEKRDDNFLLLSEASRSEPLRKFLVDPSVRSIKTPPPRNMQFRERNLSYLCTVFFDQLIFHLYINLFTFVIFDEFLPMYMYTHMPPEMLA